MENPLKISLNGAKIEMKNEIKTFGDHIRKWTVIYEKKRSSPYFPISVRPAASTFFPNVALRVKSLPTPVFDTRPSNVVNTRYSEAQSLP